MSTLHSGMTIRAGGATRAQAQEILRNIDGDGDGVVSKKEVEALAQRGRAAGFADASSRDLFHAGLDTAALAEAKAAEPGQQLTTDYLDTKMKPVLEKSYGATHARDAMEAVTPQASRELSAGAAQRIEERAGFDTFDRAAIRKSLGATTHLEDTNKNGKVDAGDRQLISDGRGGYRWAVLDSSMAEQIKKDGQVSRDQSNGDRGLREAREMFKGLSFPEPGSKAWNGQDDKSRWMGQKSYAEGSSWQVEKRAEAPAKGAHEFKLDTSRSKGSAALDDMLKNPGNYCMDCSMAKQVAQHQRVRRAMGDAAFDKLVEKHGMVIGHSSATYESGAVSKMTERVAGAESTPLGEWKSGWGGYARISVPGNDAANKRLDSQWSGEHFNIMTNTKGEKVVLAHPFGEIPVADFERQLREKAAHAAGVKPEDVKVEFRPPVETDIQHGRDKL